MICVNPGSPIFEFIFQLPRAALGEGRTPIASQGSQLRLRALLRQGRARLASARQ